MKPTTLLAFVVLCAITITPTATALDTQPGEHLDGPDNCLLTPQTFERSTPDAVNEPTTRAATCAGFGPTLRDTTAPGLGGPRLDHGDDTRVGIQHELGLGGSVYVVHHDDGVELHWSEGITHCWIRVPTDGSPVTGPRCVY